MVNKVIGILANILMIVEASALSFLIWAWFKDTKGRKDETGGLKHD